jgi:hypothetical protein
MSASTTQKETPAISEAVHEVRGVFSHEAALQDAIDRLTHAGFDRAALSRPKAGLAAHDNTPEQGADDPNTVQDSRQLRTLETSMAGSVSALAAAGVVVATGGAALPALAAAAAAGLIVGGGTNLAANAAAQPAIDQRAAEAANGELVLAIRTPAASDRQRAEAMLREAGASGISQR